MTKITRILLVEDDQFIRDMYLTALSLAGYILEVASNGDEALKKVQEFGPNLILMDILIPGKSGLEVTRTLRQDPSYNALTTKIVMLTNLGYSQAGARAEEDHISGYLVKADTTPSELVKYIESIPEKPDAKAGDTAPS